MKKIKAIKRPNEALNYTDDSRIENVNLGEFNEDDMKIFGANKNLYRAIPSMIDGLKPVARRVLYTMYISSARTKMTKMAMICSNTLQFHPHGDGSIADVAGGMAQSFSNNAVLLDTKGNPGTISGEQAAATRYLEAKLSAYTMKCFFEDFNTSNVDMKPSYIGDIEEPEFLPARYPHALINPQFSSMGYGAASNIPSYNFKEVVDATLELMKNPSKKIYLVPDSPTGADILDDGQFANICETGVGTVTMRGTYEIDSEKNIVTITSLPCQTTVRQLKSKIVEMKKSGEFDELIDIKDYSCSIKKPDQVYVQLILKPDANASKVIDLLCTKTVLEKTFPVGIKLIDDYRMFEYGIKSFLLAWLAYRRDIVRSSYSTQLVKSKEKEYMNDIILFVLNKDNGPKTLDICKNSKTKTEAIERLMKRYKITSLQASTIANMKMSDFTEEAYKGFEEKQRNLQDHIEELTKVLKDEKSLDKIIEDQLKEGVRLFGNPRKSKIIKSDKIVEETKHLFAISYDGYVKKLPHDTVCIGKVGARNNLTTYLLSNTDRILVFDKNGKCGIVNVVDIPDTDPTEQGVPIGRYAKISDNIVSSILVPNVLKDEMTLMSVVLFTAKSMAKRVEISDLLKTKSTKTAISLDDDDSLVTVVPDFESMKDCIVYTNMGNGIRFKFGQFKLMSPASKGLKQIELSNGEYVIGAEGINSSKKYLLIMTSQGKYKLIKLSEFPVMKRKDSSLNFATLSGRDNIVAIKAVNKHDTVSIFHKEANVEFLDVSSLDVGTRIGKCKKVIKTSSSDCVLEMKVEK